MTEKCANCRLCEVNTHVEGYVVGRDDLGLSEKQTEALGVISRASRSQIVNPRQFCYGDHPHFVAKSYEDACGQIVISFHTRQQNYDDCFVCKKLNELLKIERAVGHSSTG
jgi:hypothetical protein